MPKVPRNIEQAIKELIIEVKKVLKNRIIKIVLYGSYARGDYRENSDLDIMILTDLSEEKIIDIKTKIWDLAYDIGLEHDITISVLLKNINDYNYWMDTLPFYMNVEKEGVILNG